jgi:hypothetical protein
LSVFRNSRPRTPLPLASVLRQRTRYYSHNATTYRKEYCLSLKIHSFDTVANIWCCDRSTRFSSWLTRLILWCHWHQSWWRG